MDKKLTEQEDDVEQLAKAEYDRRTAMIPIPTSFWLEKEEEYKKWYKRGYKAAQLKQKESSERVYTEREIKELFIIDGKELQKRIDELQIVYNEGTADVFDITKLALYKELQQSLSPLEGILEKAYDKGQDDYVLSTGEMHSIREFIEKAFALKGFTIKWKGEGINEVGYDLETGRELICIDEKYFRPAEVEKLLGDSSKARTILGWYPKTTFEELVRMMVDEDCKD